MPALAGAGLVIIDGLVVGANPSVLALLIAAVYLPIGAVRRQRRGPGQITLATAGVVGFAALALGAVAVDRETAQNLLAAAFFGHASWHLAHHRAGRVVPRWWAEFCIVLDVILGAAILALP